MNLDQALSPIRQICGAAAIVLAAMALVKMTGFVSIRFSVTELAVVAIACALAK